MKTIQAYSFADALKEVQEGIRSGYEVDFDSPGTYPMALATVFVVTLKKVEKEAVPVEVPEAPVVETQQAEQAPKRGRKPKAKAEDSAEPSAEEATESSEEPAQE